MIKEDKEMNEIDKVIVDYHLETEKAINGQIPHYPSIVEARTKLINLIVDKLTVMGIKLNRGGILSDVEVEYYNRGAEAQLQHTIKEIKGE